MDPHLYEAAQKGNHNALEAIDNRRQLTPNKNTILHVLAQFRKSKECASEILKKNGSLLRQVNSDGETALHIAARHGNKNVGEQMITFAVSLDADLEAGRRGRGRGGELKKLLSLKSRNGDTALHEAIRNNCPSMVDLMIEKDPEIANIANNAMETPIFLAVDKKLSKCMDSIMKYCPLPEYHGPKGRTALHAAALHNWKGISNPLLVKHPTIVTKVDDCGWGALHYAALRGSNEVAEELLKADKSIAYIVAANDNNRTALHIATWQGKVKIMEKILEYCPDCWEMVTGDGQNILHLSVKFEQQEAFNFIMKKSWVDKLINQKDEEGNTPLHIYAATFYFHGHDLVKHPQAEKNAVNKKHMTPLGVIEFSDDDSVRKNDVRKELMDNGADQDAWNSTLLKDSLQSQRKKDYLEENKKFVELTKQIADTNILVAVLITTVAFAAGFTIPGGYNGNDGQAILSKNAAFKLFIITDTLAMVCSASAVILHFIGVISLVMLQQPCRFSVAELLVIGNKMSRLCSNAGLLVVVAMGAMVIAFMTGLYAILEHSRELAITECVICSFCFLVFYYSVERRSIRNP